MLLALFWAVVYTLLALICAGALLVLPFFGKVTIWQVLEHITESPFLLPAHQQLYVWVSYGIALVVFVLMTLLYCALSRYFRRRFGWRGVITLNVFFLVFFIEGVYATFELLDSFLGLRYEYRCQLHPSHIFRDEFVTCDAKDVVFQNKRNLIALVGESIEDSFIDGRGFGRNLMPRLSAYQQRHASLGNMHTVHGSDHTICTLFGISYGSPRLMGKGLPATVSFGDYPEAKMLTAWRVWLENGFNCRFVQGGEVKFACTDKVFRAVPEVEVHDFHHFKNDPAYLSEPTKMSMGINDEVVIEKHLRDETLELAQKGGPFVLVAWTLNTHCNGWRSAFKPQKDPNLLVDSIMQADDIIVNYLEWVETQPFAADTEVVFIGDHIAHAGSVEVSRSTRHPINTLSSHIARPKGKIRQFAAFDLAPTFLELTGAKLKDGRFGLGTSLLSAHPTLIERIGRDQYELEIRSCGEDYRHLALGW